MSDELTQLITVLNNPQGSNQEMYRLALDKLQQLQSNAENWKVMWERYTTATDDATKFFTLQNLEVILKAFYKDFGDQQRHQVRNAILSIFNDHLATLDKSLLINKVGAIYCILLRYDYPDKWTSAFEDLFTILEAQKDSVLIDRFTFIIFSILVVFDEEMIEFVQQLAQEDRAISMRIKDHMRGSIVPKLVQMSKTILDNYASGTGSNYRLETILKCLKNLSNLFDWIDIEYVFHYGFIDLMMTYMGSPNTQTASMEVFTTIIDKGMDIEKKVSVIENTNIIQTLQKIDPNDEEVAMSDLPTAVGECIESIGNFVVQSIPLVDTSMELRAKLCTMLNSALNLAFVYFDQENVGVSETLLTFLSNYISYLKRVTITDEDLGHIGKICTTISRRAEASEGFFEIASEGGEFETFHRYRLDLATLFKNLLKLDPVQSQIVLYVQQTLDQMLASLERSTVEKIEAPLFLFCQIASSRSGLSVKFIEEPFPSMLNSIVGSKLMEVTHPRIMSNMMDIFVSYHVYFQTQSDLIAKILEYFLDKKTILNTAPFIASRACLFLNKFVERIKGNLGNYGEPVLTKVIEVVQTITTQRGFPHTNEDIALLFTCMSNLMAYGMKMEQAAEFLRECFALVNAQQVIQSGKVDDLTRMVKNVGLLSKGYDGAPDCPQEAFKEIYQVVFNGVFQRDLFTQRYPEFHDAIIFLLHRTVTLFRSDCVTFVDPAIDILMSINDLEFFERIILLAGNVLARTKEAALSLMEKHFIPISSKVFNLNWPSSQVSDNDKQIMSIKYDYLKTMDHFFQKGMQQFFFGGKIFQFLPQLVQYWLTQADHSLSMPAQKKAVEQLYNLMTFLKNASDQGNLEGNQEIKQFYGNLYDSVFDPSIRLVFTVKPGNMVAEQLLVQLCRLEILLAKIKGASFIGDYKAKLTEYKVPADWHDNLVQVLSTGEHKSLAEGYKRLLSPSR
eukprot:CAMPEP_0115003638 /NCGR_PEP_ID=MMETSP0216-20121206/18730_1 /TAXON_ID=223996 /ORGANISM="Protocruzia adherens, Strain Boccale" /LENGTH=957 /DNA_ID=CAMNT_0002369481 /DNA_START=235 /DNA_END=3108 /DNA_ORIENTATION=-